MRGFARGRISQPPQTPLVKDGFMRYMLVFVAVNVVLNM